MFKFGTFHNLLAYSFFSFFPDRGSQSYNNGGLSSSKSDSRSSSSKNDLANANAMAQQVAALMSMGGAYGSDPTAMLQAAAIQQQLLMYGGGGGGSGEYILIIF